MTKRAATIEGRIADAEAYAADLGAQHGRNAAEWYAQDAFGGRAAGDTAQTAHRVLAALADCDLDDLPAPDLSGEWAGHINGPELVRDACADASLTDESESAESWVFVAICEAYENAFSQACSEEIERQARLVADEPPTA